MPDFETIRLTERDKAIVAAVSRYRFLTTSLIHSLIPGSRQNITRRLQRLYHAGLLDRPHAQLSLRYSGELSEFVYCPTQNGDAGRGRKPTTSLFLAHALAVSEVLIRIKLECRAQRACFISETDILTVVKQEPSMRRIQWRIEVKAGTTKERVGVIPDAAFAIDRAEGSAIRRRYFFVEVDRGTMPIHRKSLRSSSIRRKALAYARTRRSQVLKDHFGIPGFQVLFITHSKERLQRMVETCHEATGVRSNSLFIFKTLDEFRAENVTLDLMKITSVSR